MDKLLALIFIVLVLFLAAWICASNVGAWMVY